MTELGRARNELERLLPYHTSVDPQDERAAYFRGMMRKTIDSLTAIETLCASGGPVWIHHCRWILEAFGYASALNLDRKVLDEIKRSGAKTYLLVVGMDVAARGKLLDAISPTELPSIDVLFTRFEESVGADSGWLYKVYRLLCEYTHFEFGRLIAYPALGVEPLQTLDERRELFLNVATAVALWLPSFAHCPPDCGFDNERFEEVEALVRRAGRLLARSR